ncbi:hypothetical protein HOG48_02115 [Candidatus Peregrinibacteria bacterium]|jgi:predicted ATP-grasp superfamily ATP-dependent carboligase|nr:hypothetical protein [Candidatus Peregrinibacteria bacterium]
MSEICVLFGTNAVAYNIASAFSKSDYNVFTFIPKGESKVFCHSKFWGDVHKSRYKFDDDMLANDIIEHVKKGNLSGKILTFLANDQAVYFWIKYQDKLSKYLTVQIDNIETFYNKNLFFKKLGDAEFCPKTWEVSEVGSFPCIVKPAYKDFDNKFYNKFKSKVRIAEGIDELDQFRDFDKGELVCQEVLDFDLGNEFSFWGYRGLDGEIVSFVGQHMNKYPDKTGRISHTKLVENSGIQKIGRTIMNNLNYVGILDVQIIFDKNSKSYKVIEANPRLWCSHEVLLMNGINLLQICANNFYEVKSAMPTAELKGKEWFSSLYSIEHKRPLAKNTEFYALSSDNFLTKVWIGLYLKAKYLYYRIRKF